MSSNRRHVLFVVAFLLTASAVFPQRDNSSVLLQRIPLSEQQNGMSGSLQLMVDARFSADLRKEMWGNGTWSLVVSETDPLYKSFTQNPPQNAELRLADAEGHILASESLERPLARIEPATLQTQKQTFLITVDYSAGLGSYAGPTTFLLELDGPRFEWVQATSEGPKAMVKIALARTLKSDWKLSRSESGQDILSFYCRPADSNASGDFELHYVRYHFDAEKGWLEYERVKKGMWKSDEAFPPRRSFP